MSSEAGATATREHAPAEEAAPNAPNGTESSNPAAPFSAGARHLAAVRPREVVALQRLAGNAAVSRLVARRQAQQRAATVQRAASVQREGPDVPGAATTLTAVRADKAGTPAEQWTDIKSMGDDPMAKIKAAAALFKATDTLKPNEKYKGDPNAFHPGLMAIVYMDYIVIIDRTGPLDVRDQKDPPLQAPRNVVVLADTANFTFWTLQVEENSGAVRAHHDPSLLMYGVEKGAIGMYAFIPGLFLGADYAADIRKSIKKATDATPAKPGQNPDWAKDQVAKLRKRRGKGAGDGSGLGRQGTGTGGGGTNDDPRAVPGGDGQEKKEGGQGGQSKDPKDPKNPGAGGSSSTPKQADPAPGEKKIDGKAPGDPSAPKPKPLQGDPKYQVITTADGKTHLQITLDHASTWVEMREGENDASLDARIDKAVEKLQESRDPEKHGMVANPVKESGFQQQKGETGTAGTGEDARKQATGTPTNATPGERIPGAKGGANAPAYPATITMSGNNEAAPTTVSGATNHFTMELDYAAMSFGTRDEVFNRMQPINFYWEIFDVTGKTIAEKKEVEKKSGVGAGTETGPGHGAARNLGRAMDNIAEDERADIEMMEKEDWGWDARAAYLTLIGVSNAVRTVGALISSYVDLVTEPLNERAIGLRNTGEFLIRAVATPQLSDTAKADPANHVIRASSVAALAVKVVDINSRAKGSLNEEDSQLAKLEKDVKEAKTDEARKEAQQMLDAAKKASAQGGFSTYTTSVSGLRHRLEVARKLKETYAKGTKSKDMEGEQAALAYALEERNGDVDQLIKQLEGQLKTVAGDDWEKGKGEHETWVAKEAGSFKGGDYRPRVVLASEETGQVTPVQMMLGETKESTTDKPRWQLIDISSAGAREIYHGKSDTAGPTGHALAIRDAFRDFAENNDYGRGSIAIRLPKELTSQPEYAGATVDPLMRSAKGGSGRFKQRLQDLATAAEVVGLFVTGPIGVAVAAAGGIAGAIIAVDSLAKRVRTGHVVEVGTIFDILGVIGGVTSVASVGVAMGNARLGKVLAAGGAKPSWVGKLEKTEKALHIHGVIGNIQQVIVIPMDLIKELDEIGGANTGETNARRALALLRAFKSGWVTVIGMQGGFGGVEKAPKKGEPEIQAPRQLPAGHNADAADAHAAGSGPARPPQQAPLDAGGAAHTPAKPAGNEAAGPGAGHPDVEAATNAKGGVDVTTPSPDAVIAHAQDLARAKVKASDEVVTSGGNAPKPAGTGDGDAAGAGAGAKPGDPGGAKPGEPGAGAAKPAEPGGSGGPKPSDPTKPIESNLANVEKAGPGASRTDALIGILGEHGAEGAKPHEGVQKVRPEATKNAASAQPDAVDAVKATSDFGQLRRDIDNMSNLSGPQRAALSSRLQEARLGVTNEHVGKQLVELQKRFPDLEFHIQDLGTVGFNSDRDITIRVTAKDPAAYAKLGEAERAAMDRQMIVASAEAVPEMYKALEAAGFPPNKSLDTNFYTELHEGRVTPKDAAEATSIAADQQIVSMTEILLNTTHAQWEAYVKQQRDMIEGLRGKKGTPERDIPALKARLEQQIAEAEAHAKRLVGDAGGHPSPDVKNAALDAARKKLVEALKRPEKGLPEPSAREKRQLMADVKLLEPDAYGTRAAVEGVVLGGQSMVGATVEKVQEAGFRTKQQIERGEGEPGPRRLDPKTGELTEVSAEDEVGRRRAEAHGNVGSNRTADRNLSAYEKNAKRLQVAEAVLGHLLGHLPGPGDAGPKDTSAAAKNLNRIVVAAGEMGVRGKSSGLGHLSDIVAAKGAKDPIPAIHQALASWAGESSVQGWAATNGFPLTTDAGRVAAFAGWSREQAMSLTGRMRIATETGGLYGDVAVGTGRSPGPVVPGPADGGPPPPPGSGGPAKPLPSGEAPLTTGEHDAAPPNPTTTAGPAAGTPAPGVGTGTPGAGAGKPGDVVPTNHELDTAFGHLESGTGPKREPANMYAVDANALTDARFTPTGGSELDVRNVAKVGVQDQTGTTTPGHKPPETWLVDPKRAAITDPKLAADTDFRPNQGKKGAFDVRNAQVVAGPQGDGIRTPTGPTFGEDHVVGGARGATLDPATGTWVAGSAPYERTPNKLGQDGTFTPKTQDEWQAWEQTLGKLPEEQRYALWFYGDDLSSPLNHGLRGQKANQFVTDPIARQAAASQLDQAMRPIPFDTEVHRKASIRDFSDLKVSDPAELASMVGKQYAHQGYTSTAIVTGTWSGDIDIVIQVPKGTRGRYLAGAPGAEPTNPVKPAAGAPLASMPGEMEFLIERGTTFTIQKATLDPSSGRWTIEVRVAEQGTKAKPLTSPVPLPGTPKNP